MRLLVLALKAIYFSTLLNLWFIQQSKWIAFANADQTIKDKTLRAPGYLFLPSRDWMSCLEECKRNKKCVSYSFGYRSSDGACELFDKGAHDDVLIFRKGMLFHQIRNTKVTCTDRSHANGPCSHESIRKTDPSKTASDCINYITITNRTRHRSYSSGQRCDNTLKEAWYRITGEAGTTLAMSTVDGNRCGTNHTVFLSTGELPTELDVPRKKRINLSELESHFYIWVQNCGSYYVFKLKPLTSISSCYRYCTE